MVAINQYRLVPVHTVLTKEETQEMLDNLSITKSELPKILINDPIFNEIEAKTGDVICIERFSRITGTSKYYRVVVNE